LDDSDGIGPDGIGDMKINHAMGAGISNSCASYHGHPCGSAGSGGDVAVQRAVTLRICSDPA
jgi:hypothetical protein